MFPDTGLKGVHGASISDVMHATLLSHRGRGFGVPEGSLTALDRALAAGARYVEIDTRVSLDGELLVYHDVWLDSLCVETGLVSNHHVSNSGAPTFRGAQGEQVATFQQFVERFAAADTDAELMVDIKDGGFEVEHLEVLRYYGVIDRCWVVAWAPEILLRIHELEPRLRLSFSHIGLTDWRSSFGRYLAWLGDGSWIRRAASGLPLRGSQKNLERVVLYHDSLHLAPQPGGRIIGQFPIHILSRLPGGALGEALRSSRGSVGTAAPFCTREFVRRAHDAGLSAFVFSLDQAESALKVKLDTEVDVVFTNRADMFDVDWSSLPARVPRGY